MSWWISCSDTNHRVFRRLLNWPDDCETCAAFTYVQLGHKNHNTLPCFKFLPCCERLWLWNLFKGENGLFKISLTFFTVASTSAGEASRSPHDAALLQTKVGLKDSASNYCIYSENFTNKASVSLSLSLCQCWRCLFKGRGAAGKAVSEGRGGRRVAMEGGDGPCRTICAEAHLRSDT